MATAAASSFFVLVGVLCALASVRPVAGQAVTLEVRAGIAASTALLEDAVAGPSLAVRYGERLRAPVRAVPGVSPVVTVSVATALRPRLELEVAGGWTFARVRGEDGTGEWSMGDVGVGHGTVGLRYALSRMVRLAAGFGAIHYAAVEDSFIAEAASVAPLVEAGAGVVVRRWSRPVVVSVRGQLHGFGTADVRAAGGGDGTVVRVLVQAGIGLLGGDR